MVSQFRFPPELKKPLLRARPARPKRRGESQPVVFNLRCKACEKENFYGAKDVANIHGAPRLARPRPRAAGSLMRPDIKLARTANA